MVFESLDDVPWADLNSEETPGLIRRLVSDDEEGKSDALSELCDSLAHQGTINKASLAAIPFLIETIGAVSGMNRDTLLSLIATIGSSVDCDEADPEDLRRAAASGVETYLELLNSSVARDREAATVLLSLCKEQSPELTPLLQFRLEMEMDEPAKAGLLLALASLGREDSLDLLTAAFRVHEGLVQLAAALGAHRISPEHLPLDLRGYLYRAQAGVFPAQDLWDRSIWSFHDDLVRGPADALADAGEEGRAGGRRALLEALPTSSPSIAAEILETLIWMDFGFSKEEISGDSLQPEELETLQALSRCSRIWPATQALLSALRQHGLPETLDGIRQLLGDQR